MRWGQRSPTTLMLSWASISLGVRSFLGVKHSHGSHVVFGQQGDLQDFGVRLHDFMTGGGDGFARDAMDLVEGMGSQEAVVCGPNEQLQGKRLAFHVAIKLAGEQRDRGERQHYVLRPSISGNPSFRKQRLKARQSLVDKQGVNGSFNVVDKLWIPLLVEAGTPKNTVLDSCFKTAFVASDQLASP